ncbi:hypothetical protein C5S53_07575 [Methanophagales archaeon]|nr:hypothetical protein C5S53_07575 [Methanophagales archaeon]
MVRIPKNHEIKIKVPQNVPPNEVAEVILIVRKRTDNFKQKINELKESKRDTLFKEDLRATSEDFEIIDLEGWEQLGIIR